MIAPEYVETQYLIDSFEIPSEYIVDTSTFYQGFVIADHETELGNLIVYSLYTKKQILGPTTNTYVNVILSGSIYLINVSYDDLGTYALYDQFGNFFIDLPYDMYYINYEIFYHYDGNLTGYYQAIYLSYYFYDSELDSYYYKDATFYIDLLNYKLVSEEEAVSHSSGAKKLEKFDLNEFGIKNYFLSTDMNGVFYIYNNKDKLVNTLYISSGNIMTFFDGYIFVYNLREIYQENADYTYGDEYGYRYL